MIIKLSYLRFIYRHQSVVRKAQFFSPLGFEAESDVVTKPPN